MSTIVTDRGFDADDWAFGFHAPENAIGAIGLVENGPAALALDMDTGFDVTDIAPALDRIDLIRINIDAFSDGRGFSMARKLRMLGFAGRLRARGQIIADQYPMARRAGFDEVEIDDERAARQPETQWRAMAPAATPSYQLRLRQFD